MSRTKNSLPLAEEEIEAAISLRLSQRLSWRTIGERLSRDPGGLRRAAAKRIPTFTVTPEGGPSRMTPETDEQAAMWERLISDVKHPRDLAG